MFTYEKDIGAIHNCLRYLATSGNPELLERVAEEVCRLKDGPMRESSAFDDVIELLASKKAWNGVDGDY